MRQVNNHLGISSTAYPLDSIDPPKSPYEESMTYPENFLQSEMFQLEHSSSLHGRPRST